MALNRKLLEELQDDFAKEAFVPMPGGDPGMGGGQPPMDPAAAGGMPPPGDPSMGGGMPPMDPMAAGGMPPPPPPADPAAAPAPPQQSGLISMTAEELLKFIKQIVAICTNGKFGNDQRPTDGGPVSDGQAAMNAKIDMIWNAISGAQG